jgi:hypothetical protein
MNDRYFSSFHIAGFTYNDGVDVFEHLKVGTDLRFMAEPENRFDPSAVAIYYEKTKIGYIPREMNTDISKFLRLGYTDLFEMKINRICVEAHPEKQIHVLIRIIKKD